MLDGEPYGNVHPGDGFAWLPEEKIREELANHTLRPLPLRGGSERFAELHLVFATRELGVPGMLRLGEIIVGTVRKACADHSARNVTTRAACDSLEDIVNGINPPNRPRIDSISPPREFRSAQARRGGYL
jgi:hypothetical protein